ncbi:G-type lectin S-receptor-like serine/threonine-protein kinase SD2-5 isoform X1 [Nymphaea colorata]|nr:G-type lectin S-receptor-like serine/threonine-protein kinase SD2-5 isoform X1 [Nymphaea colorata]
MSRKTNMAEARSSLRRTIALWGLVAAVLGEYWGVGCCGMGPELGVGRGVSIPVPAAYEEGLNGSAVILRSNGGRRWTPAFSCFLRLQARSGRYWCSLAVSLGNVVVWSSVEFPPSEACLLELTGDGELQLGDHVPGAGGSGNHGVIIWRSGTSGQGVKQKLQLRRNGNLVLLNQANHIKWQSFSFPVDILLWGQTLQRSTRLLSPSDTMTLYYSLEVEDTRVALFLNSGQQKYSYWEFRPDDLHSNISFAKLTSRGLALFNSTSHEIGLISTKNEQAVWFFSLAKNGSLVFYQYSPSIGKFTALYQPLVGPCDLPFSCGTYGVCTSSNTCSCMQISQQWSYNESGCLLNYEMPSSFCNDSCTAKLVTFSGIGTILRAPPTIANVTVEECKDLCLEDCTCKAGLFSSGGASPGCFHYQVVGGVKQVGAAKLADEVMYFVKVPKGTADGLCKETRSGDGRKKLVVVGGVIDGLVILGLGVGILYYVISVKRHNPRSRAS